MPLPSPSPALRFRCVVLIVVERWSDGAVIARWPEAGLYAYGDDMGDAVDALVEVVEEYWVRMRAGGAETADESTQRCWNTVLAHVAPTRC